MIMRPAWGQGIDASPIGGAPWMGIPFVFLSRLKGSPHKAIYRRPVHEDADD
jgi:hypothetical protein